MVGVVGVVRVDAWVGVLVMLVRLRVGENVVAVREVLLVLSLLVACPDLVGELRWRPVEEVGKRWVV